MLDRVTVDSDSGMHKTRISCANFTAPPSICSLPWMIIALQHNKQHVIKCEREIAAKESAMVVSFKFKIRVSKHPRLPVNSNIQRHEPSNVTVTRRVIETQRT